MKYSKKEKKLASRISDWNATISKDSSDIIKKLGKEAFRKPGSVKK